MLMLTACGPAFEPGRSQVGVGDDAGPEGGGEEASTEADPAHDGGSKPDSGGPEVGGGDAGVDAMAEAGGSEGGPDTCTLLAPAGFTGCYPVSSSPACVGFPTTFWCPPGEVPPGSTGQDCSGTNTCCGSGCSVLSPGVMTCAPGSSLPNPNVFWWADCKSAGGWTKLSHAPAPAPSTDDGYCCGSCCYTPDGGPITG